MSFFFSLSLFVFGPFLSFCLSFELETKKSTLSIVVTSLFSEAPKRITLSLSTTTTTTTTTTFGLGKQYEKVGDSAKVRVSFLVLVLLVVVLVTSSSSSFARVIVSRRSKTQLVGKTRPPFPL